MNIAFAYRGHRFRLQGTWLILTGGNAKMFGPSLTEGWLAHCLIGVTILVRPRLTRRGRDVSPRRKRGQRDNFGQTEIDDKTETEGGV